MADTELLQKYRINAMHGRDVGVWVCEGSGISLSPVLFMQAVCPSPAPRPLLVRWKQATAPPGAFRKAGALPLIYSECGRVPPWPYHLHLFSPQVPITRAFEQESGLQDWSIAVPLLGIIVIFDQKYDRPPAVLSLNWLLNRPGPPHPEPNRSLAWARDQHLPYVVAALGYDDTPDTVEQFRSRYGLTAEIPLLLGPALADARRRGAQSQDDQSSGMFSSLFDRQKLTLDGDFARAMLAALYRLSEHGR